MSWAAPVEALHLVSGAGQRFSTWNHPFSSQIVTYGPRDTIAQTYHELAALVADGTLGAPIEATYALADYREAIAHAADNDRSGKVLFALG